MDRTLRLGWFLEVFDQVESILVAYDPTGTASLHRRTDGDFVLSVALQWPLRPGVALALRALTEYQDLIWTRLHAIPDTITLRAHPLPELHELGCPTTVIAEG